MEEHDRRALKDRRKQPTPALSRYTFWGRRKTIRRQPDQEKGGYVDRYGSVLFFFIVLMAGLNILDAFFTMIILDLKGVEANPIVQSVIAIHGDGFWIWKYGIVSFCLILLCLHSRFRLIRGAILALSSVYLLIVVYQIVLIILG